MTTVERTLIDFARLAPFGVAVASVDAALRERLTTRESLSGTLALNSPSRGHSRAARVFAFADPLAESPGESLSRVVMHELGAPVPRLQEEHRMWDGSRYYPDFAWPEWHVLGEFDGKGKYLNADLRNGRTAGQVVYDEKRREDRLRAATGASFARWGWDDLTHPDRLRRILTEAGLPVPG
ncbi:hypothetical protein [Planctomonas psychrotolerans]|uniref:hypothetical protein n=1 Tax=Planctomonas psychrotolerans TaxID=2528712 RepID=UPI00123BE293|nr:hypothetical protein [Planctomonas psychrotolerans]